MPPKASKADVAKKQKVVEDKTFGLKNKNKSKSVQKYVQQIKSSVQPKVDPTKAKKKKEEEKAKEKELNDLFKVAVSQPKVPPGVDPKSIVCEFFKAGQCTKGFKCKFSHDLNVQRKGEKIDIYSDKRDDETMEEWDQEMLEKVVESKKNEYNNQNKATEIVCKFFLEAVEKKQYGWFWVCPNGNKECHYRHALPPGYVLKSQMKALLEEESEKIAIEDEIENQKHMKNTIDKKNLKLLQRSFSSEGVVAIAKLESKDPNAMVHRVPLGPECWKVWVLDVFDDVVLYRPTMEFGTLSEATGSTIAWPVK